MGNTPLQLDGQRHVGETLDALDPAPAERLVDEASVDGRADGAQDSDVGECRHGDGALVGRVHVAKGAADADGPDTAEESE